MVDASSDQAKVLCFLPDLDGGGAQRTMVNCANELLGYGFDVVLAAARGDGPAQAWLHREVPFVNLGCRRSRSALWPLRALVRRLRPRVLFATMADANILAALAAIGANWPLALVLRETNSHRARQDIGGVRRFALAWAYRRAHGVVALSEGVRHELIADFNLSPSRVVTVHNPVDVARFATGADKARQIAPPWGIAAGLGPVVLGVGRLHRQKGFDVLLKAFALLPNKEAHLILVGDGSERVALEQLASQLALGERVLFAGHVADPIPWYAHATLFVLSSRWEGFGHALVEAMATGLPVIATDCPYGPADIVRHGTNGRFVPPDDPAALAMAMADLLNHPEERARLTASAALTIDRFSLPRIVASLAKILRTAADPNPPTAQDT